MCEGFPSILVGIMTEEAPDKAQRSEELKRQIEVLTTNLVDAFDVLVRDLQRSLMMIADRVEQRMEQIGFGRLSGPIVNDVREGVTSESKRFSEQARAKIQEITQAKAGLSGAADELSALASMTESEREELRKRLQDEIASSQKTREELEKELADARVKIADLEKQMQSRSTRDARRIDKLRETNKQLSESLKKAEADLLKLQEDSKKAFSEREAAVKELDEVNAKLAAAQAAAATAASAATASKKELEDQVKSLTTELEQAREANKVLEQRLQEESNKLEASETKLETVEKEVVDLKESVTQLEEVKAEAEAGTEKVAEIQQELETAKAETVKANKQIADLEAQLEEMTSLKESQESRIAELEEEQKGLKAVSKDRDTLSKDKEDLEKQLERARAELEKMKEDYARFAEVRDRLNALEARSQIQDILLKKDQHYIVLTAFATKIVEGKYNVSAKELGFSPSLGISLAAWLDKFFLDLQEEDLVSIHRTAGRGLPSANIEVSDKGRELFEEAKQKAAL
jgi:chromosome segregation ATPase